MPEPSVLLLDEPSAGLAPLAVGQVFETVADINRAGVTIVMIEQNARRALALADRGYVLEGGTNRFEGTGDALLADPQVAELYLGGRGAGAAGAAPARSRQSPVAERDDLVGVAPACRPCSSRCRSWPSVGSPFSSRSIGPEAPS